MSDFIGIPFDRVVASRVSKSLNLDSNQ